PPAKSKDTMLVKRTGNRTSRLCVYCKSTGRIAINTDLSKLPHPHYCRFLHHCLGTRSACGQCACVEAEPTQGADDCQSNENRRYYMHQYEQPIDSSNCRTK